MDAITFLDGSTNRYTAAYIASFIKNRLKFGFKGNVSDNYLNENEDREAILRFRTTGEKEREDEKARLAPAASSKLARSSSASEQDLKQSFALGGVGTSTSNPFQSTLLQSSHDLEASYGSGPGPDLTPSRIFAPPGSGPNSVGVFLNQSAKK